MATIASLTIASGAPNSDNFNAPNAPLGDQPTGGMGYQKASNLPYSSTQVLIPTAWTAADLKLQFSNDAGVTWFDVLQSDGTLSKITGIPTTGGGLMLEPRDANSGLGEWSRSMSALPNGLFRVVSIDTADETDENQAADRAVSLTVS